MHTLVEVDATLDVDLIGDRLWTFGAVGVEERDGKVIGAFSDHDRAETAAVELGGHVRRVEDSAGLDAWREHAVVTRAGPFAVRPPWLEPGPGTDLVIDPVHTFGSGSHPSTRLALALLAERITPGMRVADLGAGSGILAVAAATLGATVVAIESDPQAEAAIGENAALNGVADRVEIVVGDLAETPTEADLTVLNVTIDIHEGCGPALRNRRLGALIVAGILAGDQERRCATAHERVITARLIDGEWAGLVLDHGAAPPSS